MRASCSAGVKPSGLLSTMPARSAAPRPATRTMKNSSRLAAEIERNLIRSSSGWPRLADSSNTRRLKFSQDSSRLMKRSGLDAKSDTRAGSSGRRDEPDSKATTLVAPEIRRWRGAPSSLSPEVDRGGAWQTLQQVLTGDIYHWYLSSRLG